MITTNDHTDPATGEPKKLGIRTTAQLTEQPTEPTTRRSDLSKIITTHDVDNMMGALGYKRIEQPDETATKKGKGKKGD